MNITVLTYLEKEDDPKSYDLVVDQVAEALRSLNHEVSILGVHGDIERLTNGLTRRQPDLVFNLMETFGDTHLGQVAVTGLLELAGVRYTGCGPGEYYLQEDKSTTKKLLAFDKIAFPDFAVFSTDADFETGGNLHLPFFVKPLRMDASIGIDGKSLVRTTKEMLQRVAAIHKLNDAALVEEYVDGREFLVSVLGNSQPEALPPIEIDFSGMPEGMPKVLDAKAKWDKRSKQYKGTKAIFPILDDELRARLEKVAVDAYRALRVRDYGRVDLRMAETGELYVIEVNASCYLEKDSEFARSAKEAGMDYPQLLQRIADLAMERYKVKSKPESKKRKDEAAQAV